MLTYEQLNEIFRGVRRPFAFVHQPSLEANIQSIAKRSGGRKIRVASKSIRCRKIMEQIVASHPIYQGLMTFHLQETQWLAEHGWDHLLLGYPYVHPKSLEPLIPLIQASKKIVFMVDLPEHIQILNELGKAHQVAIPVCLDMDVSTDFGVLWFGVKRSSIRRLEDLQDRVALIKRCEHVQLEGLMGYEAQIAGVGDKQPSKLKSLIIPWLKKRSVKKLAERRRVFFEYLQKEGFSLSIVNGGGTGSVEQTAQEPYINEVTVGSGFFSSSLFDRYNHFRHQPAAFYGLEITRNPEPNIYTAAGGGYIASGSVGIEKQPDFYLPAGLRPLENEGFGEVQTPFYSSKPLKIGDCVFVRHAKAGELCERFNSLYIINDKEIIDEYPTYRGEGQCFL